MKLEIQNEAKTCFHLKVKEPLLLWFDFKSTMGAHIPMTFIIMSNSVGLRSEWTTGPEAQKTGF